METFGRYQLIKKIATGGMGQVYLARQQGPVGFEKLLVVKRILPHLAEEEEFIDMFFDEARIAAALNHPNIAQIYELGDVDGTYFIAMEYVAGESIRGVNERAAATVKGGMPMSLKCRVIAEAAAGLDFAHHAKNAGGKSMALIHRDVSPQNVLVGFNGSVKLIDFGVAKATGKISHTDTGSIKGKYAYMSPEQARGEELDPRSDIFGLGIILHELLTGQRLFKRDSETATLRAVIQAKIPAPSSIQKALPKSVDAIVLKALAKRVEDRYQHAADLQIALEDFLLELRLPATSAHLAAFMRELYADQLAEEPLSSTRMAASEAKTPSRARLQARPDLAPPTPSRRRQTFDEIANERVGPQATPRAERTIPTVFDIGALDARSTLATEADQVGGIFFLAVLKAVNRYAGPIAEPSVLQAAGGERTYVDGYRYPTSQFLRLLWKAGEVIAPMCESADQAFVELGRACLDSLLDSPAGTMLASQPKPAEPRWMLTALLAVLQTVVVPADRRLEKTPDGALLYYARELLPAELHVGLIEQCSWRLLQRNIAATVEKSGADFVQLRIRW